MTSDLFTRNMLKGLLERHAKKCVGDNKYVKDNDIVNTGEAYSMDISIFTSEDWVGVEYV